MQRPPLKIQNSERTLTSLLLKLVSRSIIQIPLLLTTRSLTVLSLAVKRKKIPFIIYYAPCLWILSLTLVQLFYLPGVTNIKFCFIS